MIIIACLDQSNGMLFNKRRQSRDRRVVQNIIEMTKGKKLWMNGYSYSLFANESANILVDEAFLSKAPLGEFCFVENLPLSNFVDKIEKIIIYRWDKKYPQTTIFDLQIDASDWQLENSSEFPGFSHETIKKEIYCKS